MAHILILSSWVAHGHVGLSAATPVLQALGHRVTQLPTVVLSNHAAWPHVAGARVPVDQIAAMADAAQANGWLRDVDAVLTGYLPTADHVALAVRLLDDLPDARKVVDPVLGDAPKGLYIAEDAARAIRDDLVPRADIVTPNAFELSWLTGQDVGSVAQALSAARTLGPRLGPRVLVTSAPAGDGQTGVLDSGDATLFATPHRDGVPNGVGDVFSALVAAGVPLPQAMGHLQALIDASLGADHLRIAETAADWTGAAPLTHTHITGTET
ncbi:PfkB family carbohydrate kinase [Psychromarinibacter halotolerans]|uniref:pyridoxal kinase n=1 Tax=Psychromarinibacter halotolerans TaxID=1775175 RepID=A0ABV7GTX8_9RHOB|nr:PfkB family carbohydrate kinase [Psychromarinibacter halotolerans]MDF0598104.1 PfkB family carbohydrate kinase [Psychromarinibacter halotolerans]